MSLRSAHLIAIAAYFGGCVFQVEPARLGSAKLAVIATGLLFLCYEVSREPLWLVQIRGAATVVKILLFACAPLVGDLDVALLSALIVVGTFVSHMPAQYRYYSLLHRRVVHSDGRG
jgi:hypothetical protein